MSKHCTWESCAEPAIASLEDRALCRKHFLTTSYSRLEEIAAQIRDPHARAGNAERSARFLEECMRYAADVACLPEPPSNIEKAQVLDVLLWASELHGFLRRSPRVAVKIPVLVRSELQGEAWHENAVTKTISRHGLQVSLRNPVSENDVLTCIRGDNGWVAKVRVVWTRRKNSDESDVGLELLTEDNFWEMETSGAAGADERAERSLPD